MQSYKAQLYILIIRNPVRPTTESLVFKSLLLNASIIEPPITDLTFIKVAVALLGLAGITVLQATPLSGNQRQDLGAE